MFTKAFIQTRLVPALVFFDNGIAYHSMRRGIGAPNAHADKTLIGFNVNIEDRCMDVLAPLMSKLYADIGFIRPLILAETNVAMDPHQRAPHFLPELANERLKVRQNGDVVLKLKSPYKDGTTHIVMTPLEFLQKLAALVPRFRLNLIRYFGVLAPNAKLRPLVVPRPSDSESGNDTEQEDPARKPGQHLSWARLLKRVFKVSASCSRPMPASL